jgi:hypothetical protein
MHFHGKAMKYTTLFSNCCIVPYYRMTIYTLNLSENLYLNLVLPFNYTNEDPLRIFTSI